MENNNLGFTNDDALDVMARPNAPIITVPDANAQIITVPDANAQIIAGPDANAQIIPEIVING